jgi:hypothetical protein
MHSKYSRAVPSPQAKYTSSDACSSMKLQSMAMMVLADRLMTRRCLLLRTTQLQSHADDASAIAVDGWVLDWEGISDQNNEHDCCSLAVADAIDHCILT